MKSPISLLLGLSLAACGSHSESAPAAQHGASASPVELLADGSYQVSQGGQRFLRVQAVGESTTGPWLSTPARVEFRDGAKVDVVAPCDGRVIEAQASVGMTASRGTTLFTLACAQAAADRASLARANAELNAARADKERVESMLQQGVATSREVLEASLRVSEVEAEAARARASMSLFGSGSGASVRVTAPLSGVVVARRAAVGAVTRAGETVLGEIGDPRGVWVVAYVFETDAPHIPVGAGAEVRLSGRTTPLPGHVEWKGAVVDAATRTVPVRIRLDNEPSDLSPGLSGRVLLATAAQGVQVPRTAIVLRDGRDSFVYVEKSPGKYERRAVVTGISGPDQIAVLEGLRSSERVVIEGALLLDGALDQRI